MRFSSNVNRILKYLVVNQRDLLTPHYWNATIAAYIERFGFWDNVGREQFEANMKIMENRPWSLHIELTNACNSNCVFCANRHQTRPLAHMSDEVFNKALNDFCSIGGGDLQIESTTGDPVMDSRFLQRIREGRSRPEIEGIMTVTNGIGLHEDMIDELIESGLSALQISTPPWRKDLYMAMFRTDAYERVVRNTGLILEKNSRKQNPMKITISFRTNLSIRETLGMPDYRKIVHLPHKVFFNKDYDTWNGLIRKEDLLSGMSLRPPCRLEKEPCLMMYDSPMVFADGSVGLCRLKDFDANPELNIGNIMDGHLLDIWRSAKARELRNRFREGDWPAFCSKCTNYCNLDMFRRASGMDRAMLTARRFMAAQKRGIAPE